MKLYLTKGMFGKKLEQICSDFKTFREGLKLFNTWADNIENKKRYMIKSYYRTVGAEDAYERAIDFGDYNYFLLIENENGKKDNKQSEVKKSMKKGYVDAGLVGILVTIVTIMFIISGGIFGCWNKYIHGNKTLVDLKQNFKYAYIETDGKTERIEISTWKDWKDSDAIQVVDLNGKVYYTHLNRVILSNK